MLWQNNEANFIKPRRMILTIVLGYLGLAVLAGMPYFCCGGLCWLDAFFEGLSAVTLTGCSTVILPESLPDWILVWRSIVQWVCGYFTILLFVTLLPRVFHSSNLMFNGDLGEFHNWRMLPECGMAIRNFALLYGGLTFLAFGGLLLLGIPLWQGFHYALGMVSTAGFNVQNSLVLQVGDGGAKLFFAGIMLLAGGNYLFYYLLLKRGFGRKNFDEEFRFYLGLTVAATGFIALNLWYLNFDGCGLTDIFCQVVSFVSTTGYMFTNCSMWSVFSKFILVLFLFVGGCAGSTAGGLKMVRCLVLLKQFNWDVNVIFHPQMVEGVLFNGRRIVASVCYMISFYFFAHLLMVIMVALGLALNDCAAVEAIFTACAALSNSGGVMSMVAMGGNLAAFSIFGKISLMLGMLIGRLEIFIPLAFLLPEFWQRGKDW